MTPDEITALAAACERAAELLEECEEWTPIHRKIAIRLTAHARALRDGRWTYSEEASRE